MPGLILQHWLSPMGSNAVRLAKARLVDAQLNSREAAGINRPIQPANRTRTSGLPRLASGDP